MSERTSVIYHTDGSTTTVSTDRHGHHTVIRSGGGGGQYGSSRSHDDVVKEHKLSRDDVIRPGRGLA